MNERFFEHTVAPAALLPIAGMDDAERDLRFRAEREPDAKLLAALANIAVRRNRYASASELYGRAIATDRAFAEAHLAAAELAYVARDEEAARRHLTDALHLRRYFADPSPLGRRKRIVLLLRDATATVNAPLELLLDRNVVAVDKCFVRGYEGSLPPGAVPLTAFGWWGDAEETIGAASRYSPLNAPGRLVASARHHLPRTLAEIPAVRAVEAKRIQAADVSTTPLPSIVRPADTHAGRGLALVGSPAEREEHLARFPSNEYDVAPFVDYRSPDGYFRKYRIVVIGGRAYPYHLAISSRWMVHYQSSPMREHDWMRAEEAAFLRDPSSVFPAWDAQTAGIARAIDLDYAGLDIARLEDGTMLVFEADPAMLVHDEDEGGAFSYKRPYVAAIRGALMQRLFGS